MSSGFLKINLSVFLMELRKLKWEMRGIISVFLEIGNFPEIFVFFKSFSSIFGEISSFHKKI